MPRPRLVTQDEGTPESSGPVLRFDGEPGDEQALVAIPSAERLSVTVSVDLPGDLGDAVRTLTAPVHADWTTVRLLLPDQTPEGEYTGRLDWSGGSIPVQMRSDSAPCWTRTSTPSTTLAPRALASRTRAVSDPP